MLRALGLVTEWLDGAGIPYALGGSALLALLGLEVPVADLDFQVPGTVRAEITAAPWPALPPKDPDPRFPSDWIARFAVDGVTVEVIGGMRARIGDRVVPLPLAGGERVTVAGRRVALAPAGPWYHLYRMYRPERARALRELLGEPAVAAAAATLGLDGADG